jgi:hypothetical protein
MVIQLLDRVYIEQMVQQSGVSQVDLGGFAQALADISEVGREASEKEGLLEHIQVALDRVVGNIQRITQLGCIEQSTLNMRQHREQASHQKRVRA